MISGLLENLLDTNLLATIDGRIQPVRTRPSYFMGLLAVTATMLLLLLAYIVLIALIAFFIGLIYFKTDFAEIMFKGTWSTVILFFMPGVAGCFVIGFMLRPLFAKYPRPTPVILSESDQPLLYAYVRRLCGIIGARQPSYIQVDCRANASASFREGRKGLVGGEVVLTIGLPLVAGLRLDQFTGVLAHEFGHFTQGIGMRLTFIVRTINLWFSSGVYERDGWDIVIHRASRGSGAPFLLGAWLARPLAWLTRAVLWGLMCIGNFVSSAMLRQMEFDADRCAARVAGSDGFEETNERIEALALAELNALDQVRESCRKNRLCDDFNLLVIEREVATPRDMRLSELRKRGLRKVATGYFDTHPCHKDRVECAKRENAPGILCGDGPATALFREFDALSRQASELFYRKDMGIQYDGSHVISTESMVAGSDDHEADLRLLARFFQGLMNPLCPIFPECAAELPPSPDAIAGLLDAARHRLLDLAEGARASLAEHDNANKHLIVAIRSNAIGRKDISDVVKQARADRLLHTASSNAAVTSGMTRINIALAIGQRGGANPGDRILDALFALRNVAPALDELRWSFFALDSALLLSQSDNRGESIRLILDHAEKAHVHLQNIFNTLASATYPFGHAANRTTSL